MEQILINIKNKKIISYNDKEMNSLNYELAKKYNKRAYIQYYLLLLKTKHQYYLHFLLIMIII